MRGCEDRIDVGQMVLVSEGIVRKTQGVTFTFFGCVPEWFEYDEIEKFGDFMATAVVEDEGRAKELIEKLKEADYDIEFAEED